MNSKYKVLKYSSNKFENIDDLISIEEPLEISLKYKESDKWINQSLSITCLLYTSPSPRDMRRSRMPSSA